MRLTLHSRHAAIAYLRAESLRLSVDYDLLLHEFEALFDRPFELRAHAAWRQKSRQLRGLIANHRIAWLWTQYPPCGRGAPRARCFCAIVAPLTDFAVTAISADP